MASGYEVEVTISSAKDLKNVNWRHGELKPYAVVWVDPNNKCSTHVDEYGDDSPTWDETLSIPLRGPVEDSTLFVDIIHVKADEGVKPLIGSAKLPLREVLDDVGLGAPSVHKLKLKRPSGRPHGKLEVKVTVRPPRYQAPDPYHAPAPYGYGIAPSQSRDYGAPQQYNYQYAPPAQPQYYQSSGVPQAGYGYNQPSYDQSQYGSGGSYGYGSSEKPKEKSKFGVGTGLAVGAVAGVLGGLAIAEGVDYVEDKIADDAAEKVEEDLGYDDFGDDD
ncbi:putative C2 domain-containing protein [Rosa chinensis]|uniref:Putative C2 domain-containing protein n=1 Tax=Rosa chinensis TaxID=74649 RepID=A0A2P6PJR4_ROSCH|nr:protein SRC2 homolog [Rosa chinensis]PRQ22160.1 putative C2 domain-containing protein [Rosa chinensis]